MARRPAKGVHQPPTCFNCERLRSGWRLRAANCRLSQERKRTAACIEGKAAHIDVHDAA